ncbi:hypothetical protein [Halomonas sp. SBBP1]|nr:hypothetical protein [Halomonas sp. SBBP1]
MADTYIQIGGHLLQHAHDYELGGADAEGTNGQSVERPGNRARRG